MNAPAPNPAPDPIPAEPIKLDIGCGKNKAQCFKGMDSIAFEGVDYVHDATVTPWPFENESVVEVHSSHFLEHLTSPQRVVFFNELYRVMTWGAKATIITPNWSHECAYGDPTHQWPPTSSWYAHYLMKWWRVGGPHPTQANVVGGANAPHADIEFNPAGYSCDFDWGTSGTWDPWLNTRNDEVKVHNMQRSINSCRDLIVHLTKTKR